MLEREELEALRPKKPEERTHLTLLAQAALKADAVTGDAAWDTFCTYIQQAINAAKTQRAALMTSLASPQMVNSEKIAGARNSVFMMDERIRSLEWTISIPAELKRVGSLAKDKLAKMDIESGEGERTDAA